MVKGKQFTNFRDTGEAPSAVRIYSAQDADELIFLDIAPSTESRRALVDVIALAAQECFMPLAVGGGIETATEVAELLRAGADKIVLNTSAVRTPQLVTEAAESFGVQCVVVGIDYRGSGDAAKVWIKSGSVATPLHPVEHARRVVELGAGEIFLNSIDRDGCMAGYDLEMAEQVAAAVSIPVIVCGGAGNFKHLADAFEKTDVSAVACASLFHFGDNNPIRARSYLRNLKIPLRVLK